MIRLRHSEGLDQIERLELPACARHRTDRLQRGAHPPVTTIALGLIAARKDALVGLSA